MKYLLDTHVFIWLDGASLKLSPHVKAIMSSPDITLLLRLASIWEIQIKYQLGKLNLRASLADILQDQQKINQLELLPVSLSHILELDNLPHYHKDPFDRILIAQAKYEGVPFITDDSTVKNYPIQTFW